MTTYLDAPADLLERVGQRLGTTDWMKITQQQVDLFAEATGDRQWPIHSDSDRAAKGPFQRAPSRTADLTLSLTPVVIGQVLQIREMTAAFELRRENKGAIPRAGPGRFGRSAPRWRSCGPSRRPRAWKPSSR